MKIYWLPIKNVRDHVERVLSDPPTLLLINPRPTRSFSTCWQLHAVQYLFNLPRAANKNNHFCVCSAIFLLLFFRFSHFSCEDEQEKQKFSLSRYNFSWKIVFQSRKHSWNFIAAYFIFFLFFFWFKIKKNARKIQPASKKKMQKCSAGAEQNRWTHFHSAIIKLFSWRPQKRMQQPQQQRKETTRKWKRKREWKCKEN